MIFVCSILRKFDINSLYICPPHLHTVATLPWKIQKVIFQQYYSYILQIICILICIISKENKLLLPVCFEIKLNWIEIRQNSSKLGQDKTRLSCLVCSCVHTTDMDKTRQSCLARVGSVHKLLVYTELINADLLCHQSVQWDNHTVPHASCQDCCGRQHQRRPSADTVQRRPGHCEPAPQTDVASVGTDSLAEVFHMTYDKAATNKHTTMSYRIWIGAIYSSRRMHGATLVCECVGFNVPLNT